MNTGSLKHVTKTLKNAEKNPTPSDDLISCNRSWDGRATLGLEKKTGLESYHARLSSKRISSPDGINPITPHHKFIKFVYFIIILIEM